MVVAHDRNLTVTETIAKASTAEQIHQGIHRDFPARYTDKLGRYLHVRFDIMGAILDGHSRPNATKTSTKACG